MYYKNASAVVLIYDNTSWESFRDIDKWMVEIDNFGQKDLVLALVANKCDMPQFEEISL